MAKRNTAKGAGADDVDATDTTTETPEPTNGDDETEIPEIPNGEFQFIEMQERNLPVSLTIEELAERGQELASVGVQVDQLTNDLKDHTKDAKSEINKREKRRAELQAMVHDGNETRAVQCRKEINWEAECARITRTDTGEVVEQRAVEVDERQASLGMEPTSQGAQSEDLPPEAGTAAEA